MSGTVFKTVRRLLELLVCSIRTVFRQYNWKGRSPSSLFLEDGHAGVLLSFCVRALSPYGHCLAILCTVRVEVRDAFPSLM